MDQLNGVLIHLTKGLTKRNGHIINFKTNCKCSELNGEQVRILVTHLDQYLMLVQAHIGPAHKY